MFGFIKKCFFAAMTFFGCNALNAIPFSSTPFKCVSMNYKECKIRPQNSKC